MKADAIHYNEYLATPRYPQRRHSSGGSQFPRRETHVPQGEDLAKLLREKRCLKCGKQEHFIAMFYADVEKTHTQGLKTYLADGHSMEELLFFVRAELDAFHAQECDEEPAVQRDEEENVMLEGIYNVFWNEGRTDHDADF
jgi:hypothetical protein